MIPHQITTAPRLILTSGRAEAGMQLCWSYDAISG
jgi:hypothetical protein